MPPTAPMGTKMSQSKPMSPPPKAGPRIGNMKVRNEIGIRCFKLASPSMICGNVLFTKNAGMRMTARNESIAIPKPNSVTPLMTFNIIRNPINPPVIEPDSRMFFQLISITSAETIECQ